MPRDLASTFLALSRRWPEKTAIESANRIITFSHLMKVAGTVADILAAEKVNSNSRVGIAMTRNDDALVAMLAVWLQGATALVADFRTRAAERKRLVESLDIDFFVEDRKAPGNDVYPALKLDIDSVYEQSNDRRLPSPPCPANKVALIGVSSGTSGIPSPVALTHECLFVRYAIAHMSPQWNKSGRLAVSAPLAFSATRKHVLSRLLDGGTVTFIPLMASPSEFADHVINTGADTILTVPTMIRGLLSLSAPGTLLFPDVRWLMSCGAPMTPWEKLDSRSRLSDGFIQNYGSTMAGMITLLETADIDQHADSVGRPLPHVLVEIVDSDGKQLPTGESGDIRVRTPGAAEELPVKGNAPERQSDMIKDGWIYPGDIGFLDKEGFLTIVGRTGDTILRGGVNIYPAEVEEVLAQHPAIQEAAVVGWPDPLLGEEIAAFVVLRENSAPREIIAWCRQHLHPDKQPRDVFIIKAMPRNANGKLLRRDLVAQLPERQQQI